MNTTEIIETANKNEQRRRVALINDDIDTLQDLLSDEFLYVHATGVATEKTDYLTFCRSGAAKYRSIESDRVETCPCGEGAVLMRGRIFVEVIHNGQPRSIRNRFAGIWIRDNGLVRLLHWQLTSITKLA